MTRETNAKRLVLLKAIEVSAQEAEVNLSKLNDDDVDYLYTVLKRRDSVETHDFILPSLRIPKGAELL